MTQSPLGRHYLDTVVVVFESQKRLAEQAMAQLEPADFHKALDPEMNSVAVIVQHLSGNMNSRWRDSLMSDGEKPNRRRGEEFVDGPADIGALIHIWEAGWATLFAALATSRRKTCFEP